VAEIDRILKSAIAALAVFAASACDQHRASVRVGIVWGDNWTLGPIALTAAEQSSIRDAALVTLQHAYADFDVEFAEDSGGDRIIRLNRQLFGSGSTPVGSKVSEVNLDGVYLTLLAVTRCHDIASCPAHSRADLVRAIGHGIGATAAHELGHQAGFRFVRDSSCEDCYDGASSKSLVHFFGEKRWSPQAKATMGRVLPRRRFAARASSIPAPVLR
jgi:hypothetical protein